VWRPSERTRTWRVYAGCGERVGSGPCGRNGSMERRHMTTPASFSRSVGPQRRSCRRRVLGAVDPVGSLKWLAGVAGKDVIFFGLDHVPPFASNASASWAAVKWCESSSSRRCSRMMDRLCALLPEHGAVPVASPSHQIPRHLAMPGRSVPDREQQAAAARVERERHALGGQPRQARRLQYLCSHFSTLSSVGPGSERLRRRMGTIVWTGKSQKPTTPSTLPRPLRAKRSSSSVARSRSSSITP
jgi:hypothetical protein